MRVIDLKKLLLCYKDDYELTIANNYIKIVGKFSDGEIYEEYINSAGGTWEGGCGIDPEGGFCGECSHFDCGQCDWKERE